MATVNNINRSVRLKCQCGRSCARRPSGSVANRGKFYLNCINYEIPTARSCDVFVWEHELEDYVNRRFASEMEQAEYHKKRHEEVKADYFGLLDELAEMEQQNRKLKRMNKVLQFSLAATAPVAATIAVASAWIAK